MSEEKTDKPTVGPGLKLVLELGPLVVFFMANYWGNDLAAAFPVLADLGGKVFIGTAFFMVAMVISLVASFALTGHIAMMPLVTGFFVLVFGGLTLWLQDDVFIKMKPTIVNLIFASVLLGGLVFGKSLLAFVFDAAFKLDDEGWRILTLRWGLFFVGLAVVNEIVWRSFSTDFWVGFKTFGVMPITMVFMLFQFPVIQKHATEPLFESDEKGDGADDNGE